MIDRIKALLQVGAMLTTDENLSEAFLNAAQMELSQRIPRIEIQRFSKRCKSKGMKLIVEALLENFKYEIAFERADSALYIAEVLQEEDPEFWHKVVIKHFKEVMKHCVEKAAKEIEQEN